MTREEPTQFQVVSSLSAIADQFSSKADVAAQASQDTEDTLDKLTFLREAIIWRKAAMILRETTIVVQYRIPR